MSAAWVILTLLACSGLPEYAAPKGGVVDPASVDLSDIITYRTLAPSDFKAAQPPPEQAAYVGVPEAKRNSVAGLINFMRNVGGSIGTSLVTTLIARRAQFHQVHLVTRLAADNPAFVERVQTVADHLAGAGLGSFDAQRQAVARLYHAVRAQAQALAYIDTFWILLVLAAVMFGLSFLLERNDPETGGQMAVG